ncbi:MAG TPA: hypothetical protein PK076_07450 [Saprospiraceae bacterium]|nr:hypothetical protein [Saprospiraceae bacterium]HQW55945.1 hypothetical protein [Saprospiraceae bacterium]
MVHTFILITGEHPSAKLFISPELNPPPILPPWSGSKYLIYPSGAAGLSDVFVDPGNLTSGYIVKVKGTWFGFGLDGVPRLELN